MESYVVTLWSKVTQSVSPAARLLGDAVGVSPHHPRLRRLFRKRRLRCLRAPTPLSGCSVPLLRRVGVVGIGGGRPRVRRRCSLPCFSGSHLSSGFASVDLGRFHALLVCRTTCRLPSWLISLSFPLPLSCRFTGASGSIGFPHVPVESSFL